MTTAYARPMFCPMVDRWNPAVVTCVAAGAVGAVVGLIVSAFLLPRGRP